MQVDPKSFSGSSTFVESKRPASTPDERVMKLVEFLPRDVARLTANYDAVPVRDLPALAGQRSPGTSAAHAADFIHRLLESPAAEVPPILVNAPGGRSLRARAVHQDGLVVTVEFAGADVLPGPEIQAGQAVSVEYDLSTDAFEMEVCWTELDGSLTMFVKRNPDFQDFALQSLRRHCDRLEERCVDAIRKALGSE